METLRRIGEQLSSPEPLSVAALILGFYCLITAIGINTGKLEFGIVSLPSPSGRRGKILLGAAGAVLVVFSVAFSALRDLYKPVVFKQLIYSGPDTFKQIVADGEDVYLLKQNGNIYRLVRNSLELIDNGTETQQLLAAGGVLYILKDSGNIWVYQATYGRLKANIFTPIDPGTNTKQIVSSGEVLYVLKKSGNIWKSVFPADLVPRTAERPFVLVDAGANTREMTSSGSVLYVLKDSGNIWRYNPGLKDSFTEIRSYEDVKSIRADGGTLYFIRNDGSTWKYKEEQFSVIQCAPVAKKLEALGGTVYIVTNGGEIFRYSSHTDNLRKLAEADSDNADIAAYYQDIFVIKNNRSIWRYNEGLLRR